MKVIARTRGSGKTTELIKISHETQSYIVCTSYCEARRIHEYSISHGYNIPFPLTYREFLDKSYCGRNINGFLIDNVDLLMEYISDINVPIKAVTISTNQ